MRPEWRGDTYLLGLARVGFGLLLLDEAWLAGEQLARTGFFGSRFHQPVLPEALVPSEGAWKVLLALQLAAALLVLAGRLARPALLASAALLSYAMLCDRLWFHHYRHALAAFCVLLAMAPCDRHLVVGRAADAAPAPAPLWAQGAIRAQVSLLYLASGGSKLLEPEWRGGETMLALLGSSVTPLMAGLLARGAIATELGLAVLLWVPRARRAALWVAVCFHLAISAGTPVRLFTAEMLLALMLFATPDERARVLRYDPARPALARAVKRLDWLRRFALAPAAGARFTVVTRDGKELHGPAAAAELAGALPLGFLAWPLLAALASWKRAA